MTNLDFTNDSDMFAFARQKLYVPVVCDVLDGLGHRAQAMHHRLRPLLPDMRACGFAGRGRTVHWTENDYVDEADPYGRESHAIKSRRVRRRGCATSTTRKPRSSDTAPLGTSTPKQPTGFRVLVDCHPWLSHVLLLPQSCCSS